MRSQRLFVVVSWLLGLAVGVVSAYLAGHFLFSWMRRIEFHAVSIVLWLAACLSFLISALAVIYSKQHLFYIAVFFEALLFSMTGQAIRICFGTAGWLVQLLFQGIFLLAMAVFCWYVLIVSKKNAIVLCGIGLFICAMAALADQCFLQPYLHMLLDYSMGR